MISIDYLGIISTISTIIENTIVALFPTIVRWLSMTTINNKLQMMMSLDYYTLSLSITRR
jgi:hypothetical protein